MTTQIYNLPYCSAVTTFVGVGVFRKSCRVEQLKWSEVRRLPSTGRDPQGSWENGGGWKSKSQVIIFMLHTYHVSSTLSDSWSPLRFSLAPCFPHPPSQLVSAISLHACTSQSKSQVINDKLIRYPSFLSSLQFYSSPLTPPIYEHHK